MYKLKKIQFYNLRAVYNITKILHSCGKDMANKYGLQHWNNSWIKSWIIVLLCLHKNEVYLVNDKKQNAVATFQTRRVGDEYFFEKLAVMPNVSGGGIGTFCVNSIEKSAKSFKCKKVRMEVYDKSNHAINFYKKRGYRVKEQKNTRKYTELVMEKIV